MNAFPGIPHVTAAGRILLLFGSCLLSGLPRTAAADFSLSYRAQSASLVLFNQPQPSPFVGVEARIWIKGDRVRFEVLDHWGRRHVWITQRTSGEVIRLLDDQRYRLEQGGWSCKDLPAQLASMLAEGLSAAGIDSLSISGGQTGSWQGTAAVTTQWAFRAPVFGLPKPVWVQAHVYFPIQEQEHFGAESVELYCGKPPDLAAWKAAFEQYLRAPAQDCQTLARTVKLPLALDFKTEFGMGTATLLLAAAEHSSEAIADTLFRVPEGYRPADATE